MHSKLAEGCLIVMIEPLRFATELAPPHIIDQAIFCGVCLADRKNRKNPKIASKFCHDCFKDKYMCLSCDAKEHGLMKTKHHVRSLLVVGPPVRKKVLTRGDAVNFPMFLDDVKIKMKARIYDNGKMVHRTPVSYFEFKSGLSGDSIHVQVIGCKNLLASDAHGSSDPFITAVYCGVPLGMTRTRHRTVNPKWTNETYVIPCASDLPPPREESFSQKNLLRLEVFDRDYLTSNDFLGHIELSRKKLIDMATYSKGQPLSLNLTARHHHGTISVRMGTNDDILYVKVVGGESLEKTDGFGLSDPFCKVYFKGRHIGTTPVCRNTVTPKWKSGNSFAVNLAEVLDEEERIKEVLKEEELATKRGFRRGGLVPLVQSRGGSSRDVRSASTREDNEDDVKRQQQINELNSKSLFVLELYDYNNFSSSQLLGHIRVPVEALRKLIPILPSQADPVEKGRSLNHVLFRAKSATGRFFRGEKSSARMSGKWQDTPSAKGYNDSTASEKVREHKQILEDRLHNPGGQALGFRDAKKKAELARSMSAKVGDVSGVFAEEEEEEEESITSSPASHPMVRDQIENVGISALLNQEIDGGSSYASERSALDGNSSITSHAETNPSHELSSSVVLAGGPTEAAELLAPQRMYSSLSNRPSAPADDAAAPAFADADDLIQNQRPISPDSCSSVKSPTSHDENGGVQFTKLQGSGSGSAHSGSHTVQSAANSHLSASEKALDAMYSQQLDDDMTSDENSEEEHGHNGDENDLAAELLEDCPSHSSHEGSEFGENVPANMLRDRGSGEMGEDGVFLEENVALLGTRSGRRRSSLFQTMIGTLGFVSAEDIEMGNDGGVDDFDDGGDGSGVERSPNRKSVRKNKFVEQMKRADIDNSCFRAIKRAIFGEVRWSKMAFFPVVKYKLAAEDLDCNRGEIIIRVLRSNRGKVLRGLDSGVRNMSLGETAQIKVRYDRAYSSFCLGSMIPPRANIVFTCELITINGRGKWGMPARQCRRVGRFFWKVKEKLVNTIERTYWRGVKKYKGLADITGPPDSYYMDDQDDESIASSVDSFSSFQLDEDEEEKTDIKMAGVHLGAKIMWGFQPEKRPVKKKVVKTEYEKLLDRQAYISRKRAEKSSVRRKNKMLASHDSALDKHNKLLNMGLGDEVDMDYQLGEASVTDGSVTSSKVDPTKNVIPDNSLIQEMNPDDNKDSLRLDLGQVLDADGNSANSSKKVRHSKSSTSNKRSKRKGYEQKEYKIK